MGVDLLGDAAPRGYEVDVREPLKFLSRPDHVVISAGLAADRGWQVGDRHLFQTARGALPLTIWRLQGKMRRAWAEFVEGEFDKAPDLWVKP